MTVEATPTPAAPTPAAAATPAAPTPAAPAAPATPSSTTPSAPASGSNGAQGAAQDSPGQGATAAATTPAEIALTIPEGFKADEALLGKFKPLAQSLGLKSEGAQQLLNLYSEGLKASQAAAESGREAEQKAWIETTKADKEVGGAQLDANLAVAKKAYARFGGEGLTKFLDASGLGNHPELIRAFYRAGKAIAEDSVGGSTPAPGSQMTDADRHAVWFPSMQAKP